MYGQNPFPDAQAAGRAAHEAQASAVPSSRRRAPTYRTSPRRPQSCHRAPRLCMPTKEEKEAGSDDMATIQTSSQVEGVSASTCSPTSILEPRSYRQRPWSSKLAARQQVGSSCCEPESSTVVEDVSLAQVLELKIMSIRTHLQLDSTSES